MKTLLAIDGNSILNRAYYGIRPLTNKDGLYTHAVYGMINIILKHLEGIRPDYAAVAFDLKSPTFRHKMYDGYKATRKGMPEELAVQLPYAKKCCEALGLHLLELEGYEADDILGTCSRIAEDEGVFAKVLTGDRDSLQLITDKTAVLLATTGDTVEYGEKQFFEKYGVKPGQFVDVKALMGDSSDNIPGVRGIGEKTALKLISDYGSIDGIYGNFDAVEATKSVKSKLEEGRDDAYLSQRLAKIDVNVPLDLSLDKLSYGGVNKKDMLELCVKLELTAIIKRLDLNSADFDGGVAEASEADEPVSVESVCSDKLLENTTDGVWAIRYTDEALSVYGKRSGEEAEKYYFCDSIADDTLSRFLEREKTVIVIDSKDLYSKVSQEIKAELFDITLAAYVLDTNANSYELQRLGMAYLGRTVCDGEEARIMYELYPELNAKLIESGQEKLYKEVELPLAGVLSRMELSGFKIDRDGLLEFGKTLSETEARCAESVYFAAGEEFNINSPKQLSEILYDRLGLPSGRKTKTGRSTDAETLEHLRPFHPIIDMILEYRRVAKLRATYVDGLLKAADFEDRVHTSFKQTVTATGRLSSVEPNLQNIPVRTELGRELRKFFVPKNSDYVLIDADYSQIELRLLAAISGDERMINAFKSGADIHTETAASVFGVSYDNVTSEMRKRAKAVNFGIMYGIGDYSLAQDIGVTKKMAGEYIASYMSRFPAIESYLSETKEFARKNGYVTTIFGRRRYIPELSSSKKQLQAFGERVAMNSPIQGAASDIIKIAMINTQRELFKSGIDARLILQVHDELIVEASKDCADVAAEILREQMENAVSLAVPLTVEVGIGESWYECK